MIVLILVGMMTGIVMGLTGAGGALIAIPLFMHFLEISLKEASVYSLLAVIMASLTNFYYQRKDAQYRLAGFLIFFSAVGSLIAQNFKDELPEIVMGMILACIALYSLFGVWMTKTPKANTPTTPIHFNWALTAALGLGLGVLTTFTGLGGGVLMLPLLIRFYHLPMGQAVATSLIVVGLSSFASFLIQLLGGTQVYFQWGLMGLAGGILVTSYLLKMAVTKIPATTVGLVRKLVFTLVVAMALTKIF